MGIVYKNQEGRLYAKCHTVANLEDFRRGLEMGLRLPNLDSERIGTTDSSAFKGFREALSHQGKQQVDSLLASLILGKVLNLNGIQLRVGMQRKLQAKLIPNELQHRIPSQGGTIVDVIQTNQNFSTLIQALQAADLVEALQGEGPFTVFAPTNAAFNKLPDGQLESLLKEENKSQLQAILQYHVVPAKARAADVAGMSEAETLQGKMVQIQTGDDGVQLMGQNSAMVTTTDIEASNGVIHVIDTVLLPPEGNDMDF
jgi:uncharacterized surface protein with fasciclin (FAS1) repeats